MNNRRDFLKSSAIGITGLLAMSNMSLFAANNRPTTPTRFIFLRKSSGISPSWIVPPSIKDKETAMEVQNS